MRTLFVFLLVVVLGFISLCGLVISVMYFPIFYFIWGIFNRKKIMLINSIIVLSLSALIAIQFYSNFYVGRSHLDWLAPTHNEILLYGAFTATVFFGIRMGLYRKHLRKMNRYAFAVFASIWSLILLLLPVYVMRHAIYIKSGSFAVAGMLTLELPILLWVIFVGILFVKYPEDEMLKSIVDLKPILRRWAGVDK